MKIIGERSTKVEGERKLFPLFYFVSLDVNLLLHLSSLITRENSFLEPFSIDEFNFSRRKERRKKNHFYLGIWAVRSE